MTKTNERKLTIARAMAEAMQQEMQIDPSVFVMGEDVGALGGVYAKEDGEILEKISAKQAEAGIIVSRIERLAAHARPHGVALAGHDDEGAERVDFMARVGATISEFPLDLETARAGPLARIGMIALASRRGAPR